MHTRQILLLTALAAAIGPSAQARVFHRGSTGRHASGVSMRKRLHVNDLITEPGTAEIDWGGLYSYTTETFTLPSALKYTPAGRRLFWGRTEYSVAFDSISSAVGASGRATQFSDRITMAATSIVYDSVHFDVAIAPQATVLLRGDSGVRLGATAIGRYDSGLTSIGGSAGWTGATSSSSTNPAGVWDLGIGAGRHLGRAGLLNRVTPHLNTVWEKATDLAGSLGLFGGVEYQISERAAIDASGQRYALVSGVPDRQVLVSFTINLGKVH